MTSTPVRVRVREPFRAQMPDGGYRPGYNVQLATAGSEMGGPRTIVGVRVTNIGSDMGSVTPMLADIKARTAQLPTKLLADANHAKHACITVATRRGVEVLVAVPKREQNACTQGVVPEIAAWRDRMKTRGGQARLPLTRRPLRARQRALQVSSRRRAPLGPRLGEGHLRRAPRRTRQQPPRPHHLAPRLTPTRPATTRPSRSARPEGRACFNPSCPGIYPGGTGTPVLARKHSPLIVGHLLTAVD